MKIFFWKYNTPQGFDNLFMTSDGEALTGLWFENSPDMSKHPRMCEEPRLLPVFQQTIQWLDGYFAGKPVADAPRLSFPGLTPFRAEVVEYMKRIPYGETTSYGDIAKALAKKRGLPRMSAQAVGGAVGWNPICLIIPCHRVLGSDGSLTGYGGGLENKKQLLLHEGIRFRS